MQHLRAFLTAPGGWLLALVFVLAGLALVSLAWQEATGWLAEHWRGYGRLTGGK